MKVSITLIESALKEVKDPASGNSLLDSDILKNIQIFGEEVILDVEVNNPSLHYKKQIENDCIKMIHEKVDQQAKIQVNFHLKQQENKESINKKDSIPGVKNIIAVASGKGGVGKSTITANLAVALADLGHKVGIIDADIYGPSMHIMFDLEDSSPQAIEVDGKQKIKPLENYGVKLLSIGFFTQAKDAVVWRGPMASKALHQLIWDAEWGELDYLLVDLPPGTGDIHLSLVQSIPVTGAIVVTTPQAVALADARKGVSMFQMKSINVPVLGIVENMAYFTPEELPDNKYYIFGKEGAQFLSEEMKLEMLEEIPLVQSVREAADIGRPAVLQGSTPIAIRFVNFAEKVIKSIEKRNLEMPGTKSVDITHQSGCS